MVVRSEPSLRRSSRRGEQPDTPVKPNHPPNQPPSLGLNQRAKRARISSLSESGDTTKRQKTEKFDKPLRFKFPLRSRQPRKPPLPLNNEPVPISRKQISNGDQQPPAIQPVGTEKSLAPVEKRMLRSHDGGSRSKSELSNYFTNYEQMISLESTKPGTLTSFQGYMTDDVRLFDRENKYPTN